MASMGGRPMDPLLSPWALEEPIDRVLGMLALVEGLLALGTPEWKDDRQRDRDHDRHEHQAGHGISVLSGEIRRPDSSAAFGKMASRKDQAASRKPQDQID